MVSERVLKIVLVVVGLLFCALVYPGLMFFSRDPGVAMIMSLYVPLGIFLLLAARNPTANRTLILYAGWANVAHAGVMAVQAYLRVIHPQELIGVAVFGTVGVVLIAMAPAKHTSQQVSAVGA